MRSCGTARRWAAARLVTIAASAAATALPACAVAPGNRGVPAYALQPAGASFEGYPAVGPAQKAAVFREVVEATAADRLDRPLGATLQSSYRIAERLAVRVREMMPLVILPGGSSGNCPSACGCADSDLGSGAGGPLTPARLTFLTDSEPAIRALLGLISSARCRIDLMMYGWEDDATGREVASALAERARQGVQVRLLVDRTGYLLHNAGAARGQCTFLDGLRREPNVSVMVPAGPNFRFDHRKLAVVDDRVAWSGSMILTEVARRRWRNFSFVAEGPIVAQYAALFAERWNELGGCPARDCPAPGAHPIEPNAIVRMVRTDPSGELRSLKQAIYKAVDCARHHIYLENPYFCDQTLTKKLIAARARGVDVRAVLTLRGNIHQLNQFEALTANRLLRGGVCVYLYPIMTHVKAMSIDGMWAYIGTGNFDELSLRNNREVGLTVTTPQIVQSIDQTLFLPDMAISEPLTSSLPPPSDRLLLEFLSVWY